MRSWLSNEDWWAVWLGLLVVLLALPTASGYDLLGWLAAPSIWLDPAKAVGPISKSFAGFPKVASVLLTYAMVLGLVGLGASAQRFDLRRFVPGFTVIFGISYLSWLIGHYAYIAQTPDKRAAMGLP